ncbi:MAG: four helix bundle protein [Ignavibacteriae bacterium]|nr:MAG: four helix bundle protein [Ignavibacteriota bacterium]
MSLESLRIHQTAIEISADIITLIKGCPHVRASLADQLRRAVVSVASNIAEGYGRVQTGERLQFLFYADGDDAVARRGSSLAARIDNVTFSRPTALTHEAVENCGTPPRDWCRRALAILTNCNPSHEGERDRGRVSSNDLDHHRPHRPHPCGPFNRRGADRRRECDGWIR